MDENSDDDCLILDDHGPLPARVKHEPKDDFDFSDDEVLMEEPVPYKPNPQASFIRQINHAVDAGLHGPQALDKILKAKNK